MQVHQKTEGLIYRWVWAQWYLVSYGLCLDHQRVFSPQFILGGEHIALPVNSVDLIAGSPPCLPDAVIARGTHTPVEIPTLIVIEGVYKTHGCHISRPNGGVVRAEREPHAHLTRVSNDGGWFKQSKGDSIQERLILL